MTGKYHNMDSCNKCKGSNLIVKVVDSVNGHISECETRCESCGFDDYWAYGFFDSSQFMESNCKRY